MGSADAHFSFSVHADPCALIDLIDEEWLTTDIQLPNDDIVVDKPSGAVGDIKVPSTPPQDSLEALEELPVIDDDKWDDLALDSLGGGDGLAGGSNRPAR
ncbi:hypothetical protein HDU67_007789 [Dinochytrium kinnereticum]|nr:hypothetical protein HDU67_007789 [Dinochytrium kinnereticum]